MTGGSCTRNSVRYLSGFLSGVTVDLAAKAETPSNCVQNYNSPLRDFVEAFVAVPLPFCCVYKISFQLSVLLRDADIDGHLRLERCLDLINRFSLLPVRSPKLVLHLLVTPCFLKKFLSQEVKSV